MSVMVSSRSQRNAVYCEKKEKKAKRVEIWEMVVCRWWWWHGVVSEAKLNTRCKAARFFVPPPDGRSCADNRSHQGGSKLYIAYRDYSSGNKYTPPPPPLPPKTKQIAFSLLEIRD